MFVCFLILFLEIILLIVCHVATNLREDQFHQLMQRLLCGHPGVEHGGNVLDIRLKGTRWGTQVTKDVWDDISQGRLTVVVFTVIIKSLVLRWNQRRKKIWKTKCLYSVRNPAYLLYNWKKETGSECDIAVRLKTVLTSNWLIPVGTNSGALAESWDVLAMESTSLPLLAGGALLPLAFCRGLFGFFTSKRGRGYRRLVPTLIPQSGKWFTHYGTRALILLLLLLVCESGHPIGFILRNSVWTWHTDFQFHCFDDN